MHSPDTAVIRYGKKGRVGAGYLGMVGEGFSLGQAQSGSEVRVKTGQGFGLVVEQNGWHINPVKFIEESKKMG